MAAECYVPRDAMIFVLAARHDSTQAAAATEVEGPGSVAARPVSGA